MNRFLAAACGIGAFAPLVSIPVTALLFRGATPHTYEAAKAHGELLSHVIDATLMIDYTIIGAFMLYTWRATTVPKQKRSLWLALLFFGNMFVLPPFWFWYMWRPSRGAQLGTEPEA